MFPFSSRLSPREETREVLGRTDGGGGRRAVAVDISKVAREFQGLFCL